VAILVSCECGERFQASDKKAGRLARCPACGRPSLIPLADDGFEGGGPGSSTTSGKAVASLVLGLASMPAAVTILLGVLLGIPAIVFGRLGLGEITQGHGRVRGKGMAIAGIVTGALGCSLIPVAALLALVLPPVQAAREEARRTQCIDNLKRIGIALRSYHDAHGRFPIAAITGADGAPLLSWRVAILPYLGREDLYRKFKLDEPWDGPHNKPLLAEMPDVFACPGAPGLSLLTTTHYQGIVGPGATFDGRFALRMADILDGASNTLMVAEAKRAVPWTKPADLPFGPGEPPPAVGGGHPGGFIALMADASVRSFTDTMTRPTLNALITPNGGEVLSPSATEVGPEPALTASGPSVR
jgi:hypothetical protein